MKTRILGKTNIAVSEIGLGCRWLNKGGIPVLEEARKNGITLLDTAAGYPDSEKIIGEFLHDKSWRPIITSKIWGADRHVICTAVDRSRKLLGIDTIDIYMIHNPDDIETALPLFGDLKADGIIKAIGICGWYGEEKRLVRYINTGLVDIIQVPLTLAHRDMINNGLIKTAMELNVGIQIMSPMAKGLLTGTHPVIEPLKEFGVDTLEQASLKFIIDHVDGAVPLPGTSKPGRIAEFIKVVHLPDIPPDIWNVVIRDMANYPELAKLP